MRLGFVDEAGQPEWPPDEIMQAGVFTFEDPDDMKRAWEYLQSTDADQLVKQRIYDEIVLDAAFYTDSPQTAPDGVVPVLEHHFIDRNGDEVVNLNVAGDQYRSNSTVTFIPSEFAELITPNRTASLDPSTGFDVADDVIVVAQPQDSLLQVRRSSGSGLGGWDVRSPEGKWHKPDRIAVSLDADTPRIAFDVDDVDGAPPGSSFIITRKEIQVPADPEGRGDALRATLVAEIARFMGVGGRTNFTSRSAPE